MALIRSTAVLFLVASALVGCSSSGGDGPPGPPGQAGAPGTAGTTGPAGPKGDPGTVDTSNFYDKATSDQRFGEARTIDYNPSVGAPSKAFDFGTIHLVASCTATTGALINVAASSSVPAIFSATWTISNRGGGSTTPVGGRLGLTTEQNLFNAGNNLQVDGQATFRTPGKVITMVFHASATSSDNTCELHASVLEPHGALP